MESQPIRARWLMNLEKGISWTNGILNWVAGIALGVMMIITVVDVVGSKFFKWPLPGGIELIGFMAIIVAAFPIAYTQLKRGHIEVEYFVEKMPLRAREVIYGIVTVLGIGLFTVLAWRCYDLGRSLQESGEVSMTQGIPFYPFVYALAFCCLPVCVVMITQFLHLVIGASRK
jgi:TRAP-type C4-dicarboxylate transport system permease small subunit